MTHRPSPWKDEPDWGFVAHFERSRYTLAYLLAQVPEETVQENAIRKLDALGIPAVPVDVGAKKLRGRALAALRRLRADARTTAWVNDGQTGAGVKDFPDIVGTIPGSGLALYLECKAPEWLEPSAATVGRFIVKRRAEEPRPGQLQFLQTMARAGAVVGVIWAPGDLDRILAPHLPLRRP